MLALPRLDSPLQKTPSSLVAPGSLSVAERSALVTPVPPSSPADGSLDSEVLVAHQTVLGHATEWGVRPDLRLDNRCSGAAMAATVGALPFPCREEEDVS